MRKIYEMIWSWVESIRDRKFYKHLNSHHNEIIQYTLDLEHRYPTTSSVHSGYGFDKYDVQYECVPDPIPFCLRMGHNYSHYDK